MVAWATERRAGSKREMKPRWHGLRCAAADESDWKTVGETARRTKGKGRTSGSGRIIHQICTVRKSPQHWRRGAFRSRPYFGPSRGNNLLRTRGDLFFL
ncbi:hypothetical protein BaRGS_00007798 [Batillaria attramentaria]|uniref:Uncharacterized protein n=1 Tax=Batillaria attramentaria TaxID=370345 RepID=A0ABD0LN70_9CAEN